MDYNTRLYQPAQLIDKFEEYTKWVKANPLHRHTLIQKTGKCEEVPVGRPLSLKAFCLFARMSTTLLAAYSKLPEFSEVIDYIKTSVYVDKYEGAAVGLYSSSIMIRDLGLSDTLVHVLDDTRKSVDELFPSVEEIDAIDVTETSQIAIQELNTYDTPNQQEFCLLSEDSERQDETRSNTRRIESER